MAWQGNVIEAKWGVMSLWQKRKQLQQTQICWILHVFLLTVWFCTGWWTQKCLTLITNQGNAEGNTLWDLQHALHQLRAPTTARLNVSSMFMFMNCHPLSIFAQTLRLSIHIYALGSHHHICSTPSEVKRLSIHSYVHNVIACQLTMTASLSW